MSAPSTTFTLAITIGARDVTARLQRGQRIHSAATLGRGAADYDQVLRRRAIEPGSLFRTACAKTYSATSRARMRIDASLSDRSGHP